MTSQPQYEVDPSSMITGDRMPEVLQNLSEIQGMIATKTTDGTPVVVIKTEEGYEPLTHDQVLTSYGHRSIQAEQEAARRRTRELAATQPSELRQRLSGIIASAGNRIEQLKRGGLNGATALWAGNLIDNIITAKTVARSEWNDFLAGPKQYFTDSEKGKKRIIAASVIGAGTVLMAGAVLIIDHKYGSGIRETSSGGGRPRGSHSTTTTMSTPRGSSTPTTEIQPRGGSGAHETTTTVPGSNAGNTPPTTEAPVPHSGGGLNADNGHHYTRGQVRQFREAIDTQRERDAFQYMVEHPHKTNNMVEHGFRGQVHGREAKEAFRYMDTHPYKMDALIQHDALTSPAFAHMSEHTQNFDRLMDVRQQNIVDIRADHPYWSAARVQQAANWITHLQLEQAAQELAEKKAA